MGASRWSGWLWVASAGLLAGLPVVSACQDTDPPGGPTPVERPPAVAAGARILMVGNSLTSYNNLAEMVEAMADSAGLAWDVEAAVVGGGSLEDHWVRGTVVEQIADQGYDAVVLQQGPSSLVESRTQLRHWAAVFDEAVREAGGRSALYMVWPEAARIGVFDRVRDSYALAAVDVGGHFLPAGEAWRAAWRRDPSAALYGPDAFHPSALGSYAAALAIVGGLAERTPVGFALTLTRANGDTLVNVSPSSGRLLQDAAAEAVATYREYRPADAP
jgi:hypothetical protein